MRHGRVVAPLVAVAVLGGALVGRWSRDDTAELSTPAAFVDTKLRLGPLALDEPLEQAVAVLGPPSATEPDLFGDAHTWVLPGGAGLTASTWADDATISGLYTLVPSGSPARIEAFGGVVVGVSTVRDVVGTWGPDFTLATSPLDDFIVSYLECVGPLPVVIKFDQPDTAGELRWDEVVTSALIAYADEPPGSGGCGTSRR